MFDIFSCHEIKQLLSEGAQLIDVRTQFEYNSGALDGAVNIPLNVIKHHTDSIHKHKPVLVYCRSGQRSAYAKQLLEMMGFPQVYNIGGYFQYATC